MLERTSGTHNHAVKRFAVLKNRMINSQSVSQELQGPEIWPGEAYQRYTQDYAKNGAAIVNLTVGSWPDAGGKYGPMDQLGQSKGGSVR